MIKPDLLIGPHYGLDAYLNASSVCDEIYEVLLDVTNMDKAKVVRSFQMAWWTCMLTYMYPHPEFLISEINDEYGEDPLIHNVWVAREVVTILLLNQPNLTRSQKLFLKKWSYYNTSDFNCHKNYREFYSLFQHYSKEENQGKNGIFFMDVYYNDSYVIDRIRNKNLSFNREDAGILVRLMHSFLAKEIMFDEVSFNKETATFNYISFPDICNGGYGKAGDNVFGFYMKDEKVFRDLVRWVWRLTENPRNIVAGDMQRYKQNALHNERKLIQSWSAAPAEKEKETQPENKPETAKPSANEMPASIDNISISCGPYKIKNGKKTDFIKVMHILNELGFFEKQDGQEVTNRNELINAFLDSKSNISKLLNGALGTEKYMDVFNDILDKASKIYAEDRG